MAGHRLKAEIDAAFFAAANLVHGSTHVVVDPTPRHAAEHSESVMVRVEQHLMCLQWIGTDDEGPAMAELAIVPPAVSGTPGYTLRRLGGGLKLLLPERCRADEAVAFDQPVGVVHLSERQQRLSKFFDGFESPDPEQVLLERADEPLGAAVAFRSAHEGGRTRDAEECDLLLEVIGHVLRGVVMPQLQAARGGGGEPAEMTPHALPDRLQRLEPGRARMGVDADAFGRAMIHPDE